ncbi:MAG: acyltransferase [Roseburia faecis]
MRKIYRIPFVGKIFRIIDFLKGLPLRMEIWERELNNTQQKLVSDEKIIKEKIKIQQDELTHEREQFRKNYDFVTSEIENLKREITGAKEKCKDLEHIKIPQAFEKALANNEWLEQLNIQLSIHPTIWGEREKLHISPRAAVFPCFFNTNSGEIFVGDYTFAGSNVNILAGSHDMHLEGLPRRDAEIKQGCDITIGKGVWLASGCTILGPCKIGDNAVVASGAVVVPNTNIPSNAVYAGIPAKKVKEIETNTKKENSYILQAMEREKGVLFIEGWSDKRGTIYNEKIIMGHIYERTNAIIYTFLKQIKVLIHKNIEEPIEISVKWKDKVIKEKIEENDMTFYWSIEKNDREINELKVNCSENAIDKLLICIL